MDPISSSATVPRMAPAESTAVRPPKAGKDTDYLMRQAARIMQNGGSQKDVVEYWEKVEGVKLAHPTTVVPSPGMDGEIQAKATKWLNFGGSPSANNLTMHALNGLTFGLGDQAAGAIIGLITGDGASKGIDIYRDAMRQGAEQDPALATGATVAGAAATGIGIGRALGLPAKMAQASTAGRAGLLAAEGGLSGAAAGAGNTPGGVSERALGAVVGGAAGLGMVGAGAVGAKVAGSVVTPIARGLTNWSAKLQSAVPGAVSAAATARRIVADALAQDGLTIRQAIQKFDQMSATGAPVTLADIVGENGLGVAAAAASLRGPAKQKMVEELLGRQGEQGERMLGSLFRALKVGASNAYDAADQIIAKRSAAATPLYEQAYTKTVAVSPKLAELLKNPRFRQAYEQGRVIANEEDLAMKTLGRPAKGLPVPALEEPASTILDASGRPARPAGVTGELPIRGLDYMKRGLDQVIEGARTAGNPLSHQQARTLRATLNAALDEAGAQHPVYAQARATWKGDSDALDALQLGKGGMPLADTKVTSPRFHTKPPELVKKELAALSPAEQEMYRVGALQDMADWIHGLSSEAPDVARGKFGGKVWSDVHNSMAKRLRALVSDPDKAQQLMDNIWAEARISYTSGKMGGSRTAPLAADMAHIEGETLKGGLMSRVVGATYDAAVKRAKTGWTNAVSDEISNLFTKGINDPAEARALLLSLHGHAPVHRPALAITAGSTVGGSSGLR